MFTACRRTNTKQKRKGSRATGQQKETTRGENRIMPWKLPRVKKRKKVLAFARTHFTMVCVATKRAQGERARKARVTAKLYKALSAVVGNFRWPSRTGKHNNNNNNNNRERSSAVLLVSCCCYCFSALCAWFTVVWQNLRSFSLFSGMVSKLPSLSCCCCCLCVVALKDVRLWHYWLVWWFAGTVKGQRGGEKWVILADIEEYVGRKCEKWSV